MWRLAILLVWLPTFLLAETATLRTGWHPTFTRVVVTMPEGAEWRLGKLPDGYELRIAGVADFDTTGFFARLPRDRINDANGDGGRLALGIDCDCHATAFVWRPDRLVVDIRNGPAADDNPFEMALDDVSTATEKERQTVKLDLLPRPSTRPSLSDISPLNEVAKAEPDLRQIEQQILDGLTRAADQGLLSFSAAPTNLSAPAEVEPVSEPDESSTQDPPIRRTEDAGEALGNSGVRARTSVDVAQRLENILAPIEPRAVSCWPDSHVAISSWATGEEFSREISEIRARIYGEFDRVDHDAVTDLARTYLFYGFGREAAKSLKIDNDKTAERAAIIEMAQIIDDEITGELSLRGQFDCEGDVALWAVLATPADQLKTHADPDRLVRHFKTLPEHVQRHLVPRMAERLAVLGEVDSAENLLNGGNGQELATAESVVIAAEIAADRGAIAEAEEALNALAQSDHRITPDALISLIDLQIAQDKTIDPAMFALLETKRFEFRKSAVDRDLAALQIRAELHEKAFVNARRTLQQSRSFGGDFDNGTYADLVGLEVVRHANDMDFLDYAFSEDLNEIGSATGNLIANRLTALGFYERALEVLSAPAEGNDMAERRYLRAEAEVAIGNAEAAEITLAGITTERAGTILSNALPSRDQTNTDLSIAWRDGDWTRLATADDGLLRDASALALQPTDTVPDRVAPLATGRELIEQTQLMRGTVNDLLNRFGEPESDSD